MTIDGISWNEKAISGMTEQQFVDRHAGCRRDLPKDRREAYLREIYRKIKPQDRKTRKTVKP